MLRDDVHILVIDDVASMRTQIRMILKSFGFKRVSLCEDTAQAARILEAESIHLILCDWHLGTNVTGLDFLQYIRENESTKEMGFIMVTAESTREAVFDAIKAGVDDYIIKPLTMEQIEGKVYSVLLKKKVLQ